MRRGSDCTPGVFIGCTSFASHIVSKGWSSGRTAMEVKVIVESGPDKKRRFQRQVSIQDNPLESRDDDELPLNGHKYGDRFSIKPTSFRPPLEHSRSHCNAVDNYQHFHHRQQPHEPYKCSCFVKPSRVEVLELERANCLASYRRPIGELYAGLNHRLPKRSKSADPTLSRAHQFTFGSKKQVGKINLLNRLTSSILLTIMLTI